MKERKNKETIKKWSSKFRSVVYWEEKRQQKQVDLTERKKVKDYWEELKDLATDFADQYIPFYHKDDPTIPRRITVGRVFNSSNTISTTKYGPISFLPKNLLEQFKRLANIWFFIVACIQLIPGISPLNPAASIVPLLFVLSVTAIKEAFEDIKRRISDTRINNEAVEILRGDKFKKCRWKDLKVGEVVRVKNNESIPADLVVLNTSDEEGFCFLETANLDGETNLKTRQALEETMNLVEEVDDLKDLSGVEIEYEKPNPELYGFQATLYIEGEEGVPLGLGQTLWRGCKLRNTDWIFGVVVYTGMQSKVMKNARDVPSKRSTLEKSMNSALLSIFLFALGVDLFAAILSGLWTANQGYDHWYINLEDIESSAVVIGLESFAGWLILLNVIIPISLYVYMEIVKVVMAYWITSDIDMYDPETNTPAVANTSNLAEELGQIEYIFSDKTGTLTANVMEFQRCSIMGKEYGSEFVADDDDMMSEAEIYTDVELLKDIDSDIPEVELFFKILGLCHTVRAEIKQEDGIDIDLSSIEYKAASPDEESLVEAARKFNYTFFARDFHSISLDVKGNVERWDLLNILEFNSDRKRMSVIVRDPHDGVIKLLCKGADSVIFDRIANDQGDMKDRTTANLEHFAAEGLRTLVLAYREIDEDEYTNWNRRYYAASVQTNNREDAIDQVAEEIERDLIIVGSTAIEDKLQTGVPDAIATLLQAGIKLWVLTGDKMETAINIGYSCNLLDNDMKHMIVAKEPNQLLSESQLVTSEEKATQRLELLVEENFPHLKNSLIAQKIKENAELRLSRPITLEGNESQESSSSDDDEEGIRMSEMEAGNSDSSPSSYALIVDGKALAYYLPGEGGWTDLSARFLEFAMNCKVVICCRVSPLQKALVVKLVKKGLGATTLAIGDGANDVPMIQQANLGVGISGKEGRQAVMSSDYAIAQFRFLVTLLLVHGHWSYRRMAIMLLYSFYKNVLFALPNFWLGFYSGFSAQTLFDSWAVSVYNILFTGLPILMVAIFDRPTSKAQIHRFPRLYERGIKGRDFSNGKFWLWQGLGIYQSIIVSAFGFAAFTGVVGSHGQVLGLFSMGTSILTTIILVANLKIIFLTNTWTVWNHLSLYFSIAVWFLFILVYPLIEENSIITPNDLYYLSFSFMQTAAFWFNPIVATAMCLVPDIAYVYYIRNYAPHSYHIIQEIKRIERKKRGKARGPARFFKQAFSRFKDEEDKTELPSRKYPKKPVTTHTGYAFSQEEGQSDMLFSLGLAPIPHPEDGYQFSETGSTDDIQNLSVSDSSTTD
eukprot:CAMPEP_0174264884 /NCGR_PEP_ID=MMETSP0439-20130205/24372_1 /TAXON_ID=0 /ORGANISM="Stereomyxa ramosa, Strain Chinc5" /LENGTH=1290 /DNA_ID=CAMNT_0015351035 /DNA_START=137 /DNA_END=4006 /DNA_ORIENTATION=+